MSEHEYSIHEIVSSLRGIRSHIPDGKVNNGQQFGRLHRIRKSRKKSNSLRACWIGNNMQHHSAQTTEFDPNGSNERHSTWLRNKIRHEFNESGLFSPLRVQDIVC